MNTQQTIIATEHLPAALAPVIEAVCAVSRDVAAIIARGPLAGALAAGVGENTDGDQQKALDVMADEMFEARLRETDVRWYASEEQEEVLALNPKGRYALAIDPLDGSSNIDVNVSIGTIFSIFEAEDDPIGSFLRTAREQVAGGYVIYGPATALVVTFGDGTMMFTMDPETREFVLTERRMTIPEASKEFAINASNYRHWGKPVRAYIDDCLAGETGPRATATSTCAGWPALVAETHRIHERAAGSSSTPETSGRAMRTGPAEVRFTNARPIAFRNRTGPAARPPTGCDADS